MEALTKTFRELLRSNWPDRDANDLPAVFNYPILGWFHGDREVIAISDLPAIAIDMEALSITWSAFQIQEKEYKFDVLCYVKRDDYDDATSELYEIVRLAQRTLRNLSRWWIFEKCYFDLYPFYDPSYLEQFSIILTPYIDTIISDFNADYIASHPSTTGGSPPTPPTLNRNALLVCAYMKLFEEDPLTDAWATTPFSYVDPITGLTKTTTPKDVITFYKEDDIVPARYIGDFRWTDGSTGFITKGNMLVRACSISCYAKEMDPIYAFGPL